MPSHKSGLRSVLRRSAVVPIALVLSLALVAGACGDDSDDNAGADGPDQTAVDSAQADFEKFLIAPQQLPEMPAVTGTIPKDVSLHFIATGNETDRLVAEGIRAATGILGWEMKTITTNRHDPVQANAAVMSALQSGADAIVTPSVDASAIAEGLAEAKRRKVPVVQIGSNDPADFTGVVDSIAPDSPNPTMYARIMAAATVVDAKKTGATAKVGILTSGPLTFLRPMFDAFTKELDRYCPECSTTFIDAPIAELTTGQAANSIVSAVQRERLNYVLLLGPFAGGVRSGLDSNGFERVKLVGLLPTPPQLQEMVAKPDGFVGWVVVPYRYDGFAAVDVVVRALTGGDPTVHNKAQEPTWMLTPTSKFDPSTLPELPVDYAQEFKKNWGLAK